MTMTANETPAALDGIRVVDFTRFLPGGYVTWLFGDMGADVIRIEHPRELAKQAAVANASEETAEANLLRRARMTQARNKRSLLLNPGNPAAREAIHALIRTADVLVEDYRPGVLSRMGYAYADMAKLNPRLIYVSVSFAGQTGPYSGRAGHDPAALALAGALSRLNGLPTPAMPGLQVADVLSGAHATIATLMALQARHATGRGQLVDVAMSDASMPLNMVALGRNPDIGRLGFPDGSWHTKGGVWRCGDGGYVCTTDMETRYWRTFCEVMGRPEYADLQHATDRWPAMEEDLKAIFLTKPRDEWIRIFAEADTQAMPVYTIAEALADPHNRGRGMVVEAEVAGVKVQQIAAPFHLSETPARVRRLAGPPGEHNAEVFAELGLDEGALRMAGAFEG